MLAYVAMQRTAVCRLAVEEQRTHAQLTKATADLDAAKCEAANRHSAVGVAVESAGRLCICIYICVCVCVYI